MSTPDTRTLGISETEQDRTLARSAPVASEAMLNRGDQSDFTTLIHPDGYWRDLLGDVLAVEERSTGPRRSRVALTA